MDEHQLAMAEDLLREGDAGAEQLAALVAAIGPDDHTDAGRLGGALLQRFRRMLAATRAYLDTQRPSMAPSAPDRPARGAAATAAVCPRPD